MGGPEGGSWVRRLLGRSNQGRISRTAFEHSGSASAHGVQKSAAQAKYQEGRALFESGQKREGLLCFTAALQIDPDCFDAIIAVGRSLLVMEEPELAMGYAERAIRIAPEDGRSKNLLVVALMGSGDQAFEKEEWPAAYQWYKRALLAGRSDANATNIVNLLGAVWQRCDMGDDFIALCQELLKLDPRDNNMRFKLGNALIKCRRYTEALPVCIAYVDRDQACVKGRWQLGIAHVANGNVNAAEGEYKFLERFAPELAADLRTFID